MYLYLVQHAKAKAKEQDPQRGINIEGQKETEKIALFLKKLNPEIQEIWHSGKKRAVETADIIAKNLTQLPDVKEHPNLNPTDDIHEIDHELQNLEENIMLVGHLPFLDRLASFLLSANQEQNIVQFKNSGVVCLERSENNWHLLWSVIPDLI